MKTYLLPPTKQYKGNMHSHSTCSDGRYTVQELKEAYKARGYSVFAFSDHTTVIDHSELDDEDFLTLSSCEIAFSQPGKEPFQVRQSCHFNLIARNQHDFVQIKDGGEYSFEHMNEVLKEASENGYIVNINHPNWSLLSEDDFLRFENVTGMEVTNTITANYGGALSYSFDLYLNALRKGKKWIPLGGDDNHSFNKPFEHPLNDSFGSITYFCAPALTYADIIEALDRGNVYCSQSPEIKELYIDEEDVVHIVTSPAAIITMNSDKRYTRCALGKENAPVTSGAFKLDRSAFDSFIVFNVVDEKGLRATTRAYYKGIDF